MFGDSYLLVQISRAVEAQSSPRRNCLPGKFSFGFAENRAATAHTESTRTGGSASLLRLALEVTYDTCHLDYQLTLVYA
jgi:hypothetical protein